MADSISLLPANIEGEGLAIALAAATATLKLCEFHQNTLWSFIIPCVTWGYGKQVDGRVPSTRKTHRKRSFKG
ncbi:MAG: hypothetical protein DRQ65_06210 [Gammaproteobacteria bacterium]|nr:MAG: hypothetical protein DRQ65_06210 [Gammaproteobacteria bacterium]RLA56241.1 MAG: hypothetical protein DRQ98_02755 [Gammaproteobacteria bacterium]